MWIFKVFILIILKLIILNKQQECVSNGMLANDSKIATFFFIQNILIYRNNSPVEPAAENAAYCSRCLNGRGGWKKSVALFKECIFHLCFLFLHGRSPENESLGVSLDV